MKRGVVFFMLVLLAVSVAAQENVTKKKRFIGTATIKSGAPQDYTFKIASGIPIFRVASGESIDIKLYTRKSPEGEYLNNVVIEPLNEDIQVELHNGQLSTLNNNQMPVLELTITAPSELPQGDYVLKFNVESDEFPATVYEPKPDIIIRVSSPRYLRNSLLAVGIVSILGLVTWRRFHQK